TCPSLGVPAFCQKQHFAARRSCCLTTPVLMPCCKAWLRRRGPTVFSSSLRTLFPTDRFEFADLLLIHKLASLSTALRPVLLAHRLSFKLAALSLVAVSGIVRRHCESSSETALARSLFRSDGEQVRQFGDVHRAAPRLVACHQVSRDGPGQRAYAMA